MKHLTLGNDGSLWSVNNRKRAAVTLCGAQGVPAASLPTEMEKAAVIYMETSEG